MTDNLQKMLMSWNNSPKRTRVRASQNLPHGIRASLEGFEREFGADTLDYWERALRQLAIDPYWSRQPKAGVTLYRLSAERLIELADQYTPPDTMVGKKVKWLDNNVYTVVEEYSPNQWVMDAGFLAYTSDIQVVESETD